MSNIKNICPKAVGKSGEDLACSYLRKNGYLILKRNFKISYQEIDIIASKNQLLIFLEVKTSCHSYSKAADYLSESQIVGLSRAVRRYCFKNNFDFSKVRADLIAVDINRLREVAKISHYYDII